MGAVDEIEQELVGHVGQEFGGGGGLDQRAGSTLVAHLGVAEPDGDGSGQPIDLA